MSEADSTQGIRTGARHRLQERYDQLWSATVRKISAGTIELDPVLASRLPDRRRGLTVIARPSADVRKRAAAFLGQLRNLEADQHYYAPSELHVTILPLFTATVEHTPFLAQTEEYLSAVDSALQWVAPIRIEFRGVTASPDAVMIQGFVENGALNDLRDTLRAQLQARGLAEGLDSRYRLETAHMTIARFRARLRDGERFATELVRSRQRSFGAMRIKSLSLVKNDWYMTNQVLETVKHYRLSGAG